MLECYNKVTPQQFEKMGDTAKDNICLNQKEAVKQITMSNDMVISNLIKERVQILHKLGAKKTVEIREFTP